MNLTVILSLVVCLQVSANAYSQKTITLSQKNVPLETVFKEIKKQTGYTFFCKYEWLQQARKVDIDVKNASLDQVLELCFKDQPLTYAIVNTTIMVRLKEGRDVNGAEPSQLIDIKGKVINDKGEALSGASVEVEKSRRGTYTDANGMFELKQVDANAVLLISFTGYAVREITVNGNAFIPVSLALSASSLDETVVIAYGTTTQRLNTGNVSTVKAADIEKQPVSNPLLALEGRVPGMVVTQNTGVSGGGITVRIQGQNSLNRGTDPLYVIDGVPYTSQLLPNISTDAGILGPNGNTNSAYAPSGGGNPLSYINPLDIESIDVLKDADATAIYGSRAANGAILITTKKGKAGPTKVDFNVQNGWGKVTRMLPLLNTQQYLEMRTEAFANDSLATGQYDYDINGAWDKSRYTDWQKALIGGTAHYTDAQATISGGNNNTQFLLGTGYHRETTVFPGDLADRKGSIHFNINHSWDNQRLRLQFDWKYLVDDNKLMLQDLTPIAIRIAPNAPALYNSDGSFNWAPLPDQTSTWYNPLANLYNTYEIKTNNAVGNVLLSYQIIPGLDIKSSFGYTNLQMTELGTLPLISTAPEFRPNTDRYGIYGSSNINSWNLEPQITYKKGIAKGKLDFLLGATIQQTNKRAASTIGTGYNNDKVIEDQGAASSLTLYNPSVISVYKYNAAFGRLNYNWQDKYIMNLTGRRDGSSRFGSANLFHNFWSIAGAWIFSNENFSKTNLGFLSFGKLRTSYGTTGNDQIGDYQFMSLYRSYNVPASYQSATGIMPAGLPNPYLQWEETKKLQFGLDLGFFQDRVLVNTNYYYNRSSNMLTSYALPIQTGNSSIQVNLPATIQNTGWEFSINTKNFDTHDFTWSSNVNITFPKNKLISFPGLASSSYAGTYLIGQPVTVRRTLPLLGVNSTSGLYEFADTHGVPTSSPDLLADKTAAINIDPKLFGGVQNSFRYKGFTLDILFQFVKKMGYNYFFGNMPGYFTSDPSYYSAVGNQPVWIMNRWQKSGDIKPTQKFSATYPSDTYTAYSSASSFSTAQYSDASYIRLKNISFSWEFPKGMIKTMHLQNFRLYVQGQNILTSTNYKGMDPENSSPLNLPPLKIWTLGLQVSM